MILDMIVVIVIIVAICLGFKYGFLTYVVKIASLFTGLLMSICLVNPISSWVMDSSIGAEETQMYVEHIESSKYYVEGNDDLQGLLIDIGIPSVLASFIDSFILTDVSSENFVHSLAGKIASISISIKVFFIVLICSTFLIFFVKIFIKSIRKFKVVKFIDGVLGVGISLILSVICGYIMLTVIFVFTGDGIFDGFNSFMNSQYEGSIGIYSIYSDHNFIYNFFSLLFS